MTSEGYESRWYSPASPLVRCRQATRSPRLTASAMSPPEAKTSSSGCAHIPRMVLMLTSPFDRVDVGMLNLSKRLLVRPSDDPELIARATQTSEKSTPHPGRSKC